MVNDCLSDFVARVKNGYRAGRETIDVPNIKVVTAVAETMVKAGYLKKVEKGEKALKLTLKYENKEPVLMGIKRVSTPGSRVYSHISDVKPVWGGLGISILSTPKGILTSREARKLNVGGEIICQIW
jgi:small subunit ribosomal protein S8